MQEELVTYEAKHEMKFDKASDQARDDRPRKGSRDSKERRPSREREEPQRADSDDDSLLGQWTTELKGSEALPWPRPDRAAITRGRVGAGWAVRASSRHP